MILAVFAYWYLPYDAQSARFLTGEEKKLAFLRIQLDSSSVVGEKLNLREAGRIFLEPTSWVILGKPFPMASAIIAKFAQALRCALASLFSQSLSSFPS